MHQTRPLAARRTRLALLAVMLVLAAGLLAACGQDKGDPIKISRTFIVSVWTGDAKQVEALTCKDWQSVTRGWAAEGDPTLTVDIDHATFEISAESNDQVEVVMSGVVTFKSAENQTEVRNLDEDGTVRFTLVDENGWKVCDLR
jgi:hypothetical protein